MSVTFMLKTGFLNFEVITLFWKLLKGLSRALVVFSEFLHMHCS